MISMRLPSLQFMQKETFLSLTSSLQHNGLIDVMYGSFFKTISHYIKKKKKTE